MPIGSRFSTSADGRLEALPSMPPPEPPGSPPGSKGVLEEHGALQGVSAIAGAQRQGRQRSVFDDAVGF